jgi:DnaJ-class molecular chaperone
MSRKQLDVTLITEKYRILGLAVGASKDELRQQRNKMIMKFHPDRHPGGWYSDDIKPEQRMHLVQGAYRFLMENFDAIQEELGNLSENCFAQRSSRSNRSHWIYSEVESYDKTHDSLALQKKFK